jgi:hypothetical protein
MQSYLSDVDHAMHLGDLRDGMNLQQGSSAVCTLAHSGRTEHRRVEIEVLTTPQQTI